MPELKPQGEKSDLHVAAQPHDMGKNSVQLILAHDLAGYGTNEIAEAVGLTASRVSIIKGSPLYQEERQRRWELLKQRVVEGTAKAILEDPARAVLAEAKTDCARMKVELALNGRSEFVRSSACSDVLAMNGIKPESSTQKGSTVTVVMEERLAKRFGFAKDYDTPAVPTVEETSIERRITFNA